eukprot:m.69072 g.69072  ORF g.69072 m.69072 type:complete len:414 (+) comp13713_c0_seq1:80-1321(+)
MADQEFRVSLFTRLDKFKIDLDKVTVPGTATRAQLSKLVNELLQREKPLPFDFIVNEEFLRTTIADVVLEHNLPTEEELSIEYVLALLPPEPQATSSENDWISSIVTNVTGDLILASCYDNLGRIFDGEGNVKALLQGHVAPVRDICWVPTSGAMKVATVSQDEHVILHTLNPSTFATKSIIKYTGHNAAVNCVAARGDGSMICSGGWDHTIRIWPVEPEEDDLVSETKKSKTEITTHLLEDPLLTMNASVAAVTSLLWPSDNTIYSASDDHCLKKWDVVSGNCVSTLTGPKVIDDIDLHAKSGLIAAACFDGAVRIYDSANDTFRLSHVITCHSSPVASVAWNPHNEHQFVAACLSEETNLRIWDIRSQRVPVCGIASHKDKVLAVKWTEDNRIISGGADGNLVVHAFTIPQ